MQVRIFNGTSEDWVVCASHLRQQTEINVAGNVGLGWAALRSGRELALQVKHLDANLAWKNMQTGSTSGKFAEVNATHVFSPLEFCSKMVHLLSKYTFSNQPGLCPSADLEGRPPEAFDLLTHTNATSTVSSLGFTSA